MAGELGAKLVGVQTIRESDADYQNYRMQNSIVDPFGEVDGGSATIAAGLIHISESVGPLFRNLLFAGRCLAPAQASEQLTPNPLTGDSC